MKLMINNIRNLNVLIKIFPEIDFREIIVHKKRKKLSVRIRDNELLGFSTISEYSINDMFFNDYEIITYDNLVRRYKLKKLL